MRNTGRKGVDEEEVRAQVKGHPHHIRPKLQLSQRSSHRVNVHLFGKMNDCFWRHAYEKSYLA